MDRKQRQPGYSKVGSLQRWPVENLTHSHIVTMFLSLGILLAVACMLGETARRFHQPPVLGELLAGILLGPTVLGNLLPEFQAFLFPAIGPGALALEAISTLAIVLFLMVAGIHVDLSTIWRQDRVGFKVGLSSILVPFLCVFAVAWEFPELLGRRAGIEPLLFSLFMATAISISALPIIAKTLMDMDLYRSDLGMVVISDAIFNDLVGWIVFAVLLGLMGGDGATGIPILTTILLTLAFAALLLGPGRWCIDKVLPFVQAYTRWPAGELSFTLILALLGAAFTQWIGIHAIFGAFLVGAAVGDSPRLREYTRVTIDNFVSFIFAPVFFASIGLKVNFATHLDAPLLLTVLLLALGCKLAGGFLGARWAGMPTVEAAAVGASMISVGAMGIIVGLLAMQEGIIGERLFVAIVVMAITTSMISGPLIRRILHPATPRRIESMLSAQFFQPDLKALSRRQVIREMTATVSQAAGLDAAGLEAAVWQREQALSTGIGKGVALPHARVDGLPGPIVAMGISIAGIDFDAPDGKPAHVIFMVLTPSDDPGAQLEIAAQIARLFKSQNLLERMLRVQSFTDALALINVAAQLDAT